MIMGNRRTIITIPEKERAWLEAFSKTRGISLAEAIRRGIAELRQKEERSTYKRHVEETGGTWRKGEKGPPSL